MENEEVVQHIIEIVAAVALVFVSLGFKRGLKTLVNAIEKADDGNVKKEVSLNAKGIAAFLINLYKKAAERKNK